jgi:hypothetical protein
VRVITADRAGALREIARDEPVLLTLAARRQLGETPLSALLPHSPSVSPQSAAELLTMLIRFNVAAKRES